MPFASGYTMAPKYNWDSLGRMYIAIACVWTFLIICGIVFLLANRNLPFLRIRNIPLLVSAVATLHVYWILCMTAYSLNGNFPCGIEYWIMSIYLPLGIALYQASNTQLLDIAHLQKKFVYNGMVDLDAPAPDKSRPVRRQTSIKWVNLTQSRKSMLCIAVGMVFQLMCALVIYLVSRMFHPNFGLVGHATDKFTCRKGWQWLPSILWQLTWSWLYAPYLLWRVRNIDDVHCWRLQTIICSVAGMVGSPMWLAALYVPAMKGTVDYYWPAPLWFAPSVALMEACVIFMPCWQAFRNRKLKRETLQVIAEWEEKQRYTGTISSDSTKVGRMSLVSHKPSTTSSGSSRRGEMYTMQALEKALATNPTPLLLFAALKDFSGENIGFLKEVRDWKANWSLPSSKGSFIRKSSDEYQNNAVLRRKQFNAGVQIYSSFVSLRYSSFPVNLSSAHSKGLEAMFEGAAALVNAYLPDDTATPFNSHWSSKAVSVDTEAGLKNNKRSWFSTGHNTSADGMLATTTNGFSEPQTVRVNDFGARVPSWVEVPTEFGPKAFNNAEESIKYMVLTNTWPKFVAAGYASSMHKDTTWVKWKRSLSHCVDTYGQSWVRLHGR